MKNKSAILLSIFVFFISFGVSNLFAQEVKTTETKTDATTDQVLQDKETSKENVSTTTIEKKETTVQTTTDVNRKELKESNPELYKQMKKERQENKKVITEEMKLRKENKEQHQMEMKQKKEERQKMKDAKDNNTEAPQIDIKKETTDDSTEK